jgi:Fe-S cluster assembly protein SufD
MSSAGREHSFLAPFDAFVAGIGAEASAASELRRQARSRFAEVGFPTQREEEWRHTNLGPLARSDFRLADSFNSVPVSSVDDHSYDGCDRLVFVNGRFSSDLSRLGDLPAGVVVTSLRQQRASGSEVLGAHFGRLASFEEHPFVALNTAFHDDGALVVVPRGTVLERPLQLLYLASNEAEGTAAYPRNLIIAGENSQSTIIESYVGLSSDPYFNCAVTEIVAEDGAVVDHYKMQKEGAAAFHIAAQFLHLGRAANFSSCSISEGGGLVRNDIGAALAAEGIECTLNGLYVVTDRQFVDNHMRVEHIKPHCDSHELYKGILDGHARAVFNGRIYVHQDAQKTDAKQTNRNLLLSENALVNSNPQLEIFADDVRCTHGSTVGQLDEDALFYLRSRGIELEAARSLMTWAFASELVRSIKVEVVRSDVEEFILGRLAAADVVRQAI